jgi:uncharacterized membrane protein YtjA (UPF0391 family)
VRKPTFTGGYMLRWAVIFLIIALISAALGFGGIAGLSMEFAKILFLIFIILFIISLIFGVFRGW